MREEENYTYKGFVSYTLNERTAVFNLGASGVSIYDSRPICTTSITLAEALVQGLLRAEVRRHRSFRPRRLSPIPARLRLNYPVHKFLLRGFAPFELNNREG